MAEPPPRLEMTGIAKRFGRTEALAGVDLAVASGEALALVGENGAGKSTLMKVLAGVVAPDTGGMRLGGAGFSPRAPADARRRGVAMIHQEISLAPHLSVAENVALGMEPARGGWIRWGRLRDTARTALARLDHAEIHPDTPVSRLPLAQQQVVEIARGLVVAGGGRGVLILDEPTSSLSAADARRLFDVLRRLRAEGEAIVYITHFLEEVFEIGDRYAVLRDGRSVGAGAVTETDEDELIRLMVGRSVERMYPRTPREPGAVALEARGIAGASAPRRADLTLHRGEVLGIGGLVGAGRTELLRAIFGLDRLEAGEVRIDEQPVRPAPRRQWAAGAGFLSEDRQGEGLALGMSVADNVTLSRLAGLGPGPVVRPRRQRAAAGRWIERLGIRCRSADQAARDLSGGNQQKVAVARLLHHDASVLLLDEPTRGVDVGSKAEIYALIDELRSEGRAILLVSSYLPELLGVCDRVAVMRRGELGPARPVAAVDEESLMHEATQ